ncbi:hypothetical protein TruAng_004726 [Truncatella angustata]|nr:hypothetical protein TruAng_004726 [Truncatella angustata]
MAEATQEQPTIGEQTPAKTELVAHSEDISLRQPKPSQQIAGYFETAQWTADGTTILTTTSSDIVSAFVLPSDLLEARSEPLSLSPQASVPLGDRTNVLASAPYFNLSQAYTNQILVSSRDHPIQLFYLFPPSHDGSPATHTAASAYPLTKAHSETFETANSLLWPSPGSHFIAGCKNFIAKFDVSRTGEEPLLRIKTIPSERHLSKGGGVGMRGTISTLSAQPSEDGYSGLTAAGTWTRWIGLYDFAQAGECTATWNIESAVQETRVGGNGGISGEGITQTIWSPCGRYLLVSERKSGGILVYDVRVTGQLLGWLEDRVASSNQKISCDVFPSQDGGFEVWSGTTSGTVKVWEGVGLTAGAQKPSWDWQAHESTVGSTCLHPTGTVIATCSGSWDFHGDKNIGNSQDLGETGAEHPDVPMDWLRRRTNESTLKIWTLGATAGGI